jgi:deaminated glutathione amidase
VNLTAGPQLRESDAVRPGDRMAPPVATPWGAVGVQTCYDVRFPEVARYQRRRGAHVLTYPSAFTVKTGQAHWGTAPASHPPHAGRLCPPSG